MIVIEERFEEMIDVLPEMINGNVSQNSYKVKFSFGDDKELMSYLISKKLEVYPLIWMIYPVEEKHTLKKVTLNSVSFILAVRTNNHYLNKERFATNYKNVLIPLYNNFVELLERSNIVNLAEEKTVVKFPNYSNKEQGVSNNKYDSKEKNKTIDIWDAIKVTVSCSITDSHFRKNIRFVSNTINN